MTVAVHGIPGNLPAELTAFVGRRREIAEVKRLLPQSRLVTLTGIGGVGKTRLALRVAEEMGRAFPDGVWVVDLAGTRDRALVAETVTATLRLREQLSQPPAELLAEFLAERHLLLVLDNCEHVIDAVAVLADALLRASPQLRIFATSREPLRITGEMAIQVDPLSVPDAGQIPSLRAITRSDAVTLFTARAHAADAGFELTEDNKVAVLQICRRLEGLPLAIELTAARFRVMSAEQILNRLTDRYRLLTSGGRGTPTRQQTLRRCIDWSYDLLDDLERQLWGRLAVFAGGFELDAAEAVCGADLDPGEVLDLVTSLIDKSILIREDTGSGIRYRMLETLREYGWEKTRCTDEVTALRRRHRDWYVQLAQSAYTEWIGPQQLDWITRLSRELPNLHEAMEFSLGEPGEARSALKIAVFLYEYWVARASISEARYWLGRALEATSDPTAERIAALCADTVLAAMQTDTASSMDRITQARPLAERSGDKTLPGLAAIADGSVSLFSGDLHGAAIHFEQAMLTFSETDDVLHHVSALLGLALAYGLLGESDRAADCQEQALALTRARGESIYRSYALCLLSYTAVEHGDLERGTELGKECLRLTRANGDRPVTASSLATLAWVAAQQGRTERSAVLAAAAVAVGQSAGNSTVVILEMFGHHHRAQESSANILGQRKYAAAARRGRGLDFDAALDYALGDGAPAQPQPVPDELTPRERQVAALVAEGLTNQAIADKLVISRRTVESHVENILNKLQFNTRTQIAAWMADHDQEAG